MTLLIADDEENDAVLVVRALRSKGVEGQIIVVPDGSDVVRYLAGSDEFADRGKFPMPDLIVLDLKMRGLETLAQIAGRREWARIPVVVLSGFSDLADVKRAYALGAKTFFTKPLQGDDIQQMAGIALGCSWVDQVRREK